MGITSPGWCTPTGWDSSLTGPCPHCAALTPPGKTPSSPRAHPCFPRAQLCRVGQAEPSPGWLLSTQPGQPRKTFWRGGEKLSQQRRKSPRCVLPVYTLSFRPLHRHSHCQRISPAAEHHCCWLRASQCLKAEQCVLLEVPARAFTSPCSCVPSGSATQCKNKPQPTLFCVSRAAKCALAGSWSFAPAVPYLADGACKTHPAHRCRRFTGSLRD